MSTEAQKRASTNYNRKQDNIMVRPDKETGAAIRAAAVATGMSVQAYVLRAVRAWMEQEQAGAVPAGGSPAVSPENTEVGEDTGIQGGVDMVFCPPAQNDNSNSRSSSLTPSDSPTGLDAEPISRQESL